jgi:hypothetical protein
MSTIRANAFQDNAGGNTATFNGIELIKATQAEAEAGSDNTAMMTPLRTQQLIDVTEAASLWTYNVPTGQTVAYNSLLAIPHGLAAKPKEVQVSLRCTTAQSPYAAQEEVFNWVSYFTGGTFYGATVSWDATDILVYTGAALYLPDRSGSFITVTVGNWRYIARARG